MPPYSGLWKPDPAFFQRICDVVEAGPEAIAYVGDRIDNDVLSAKTAEMLFVHVRRGPWGVLQHDWLRQRRHICG